MKTRCNMYYIVGALIFVLSFSLLFSYSDGIFASLNMSGQETKLYIEFGESEGNVSKPGECADSYCFGIIDEERYAVMDPIRKNVLIYRENEFENMIDLSGNAYPLDMEVLEDKIFILDANYSVLIYQLDYLRKQWTECYMGRFESS